jgi:hypothetical protein
MFLQVNPEREGARRQLSDLEPVTWKTVKFYYGIWYLYGYDTSLRLLIYGDFLAQLLVVVVVHIYRYRSLLAKNQLISDPFTIPDQYLKNILDVYPQIFRIPHHYEEDF